MSLLSQAGKAAGAVGEVIYKIRGDNSSFQDDLNQTEQLAGSRAQAIGSAAKKGLAVVGAAATAAGAASIKMGMEFDTSLAKASTLFGEVNVDQQALAKNMLAASSATGIAAADMGEALYNALSAGVPASEDMSEALSYLESSAQLARAGFTDLDTASSATVSVLNAYGMSLEEIDRVQKILMQTQNKGITTIGELGNTLSKVTPIAASNSVSFEQVGAALSTITAQKTPAAEAATQLHSMIKELGAYGSKASTNLKAAAEGTEYAGQSFQQMMDSGADLSDVLLMLSDYASDAGMSISDMFSDSTGGQAALVLTQQVETFTDDLSAMATEADVVQDAVDKLDSDPATQMADALNSLKNVGIQLYENVLQPLVIAAAKAVDWMVAHKEIVVAILITITGLFIGLAAASGALGTAFALLTSPITLIILAIAALIAITVIIVNHWEEIKEWLIQIWTDISEFFIGIWTAVSEFFIGLWESVSGFFIGIWTAISEWFTTKITNISQTFTDVWTAVSTFFTNLWTTISDFFTGIWEDITTFITDTLSDISETWTEVWTVVDEFFTGIWEGISEFFTGLWEGLVSWFTTKLTNIAQFYFDIWNSVSEFFKNLWQDISDFFVGIWEDISDAFQSACEFVSGIFSDLSETISSIWSTISGVFQSVLDWLNNTFVTSWANIWSTVSEFFKGIWEGIKAAFKTPINWIIDGINTLIRGVNNLKIPDNVPIVGGISFNIKEIPRLRVGMDYVPEDDFPALLHRGEAVLTAEEAADWRQQQAAGASLVGVLGNLLSGAFALSPALAGAGEVIYNFEIPKLADSIVVREDADIDKISASLYDRFAAEKRSRGIL